MQLIHKGYKGNAVCFMTNTINSTEFMMLHHTMWFLSIEGDVTPELLRDCLGSMAKALADEEGHPDAKDDVESYVRIFEEALPIELLALDQSCSYYYDGYVYTAKRSQLSSSQYAFMIE